MTQPGRIFEPAPCGHCDGLGCMYCGRTGTVLVESPRKKCQHCEGVGCIYCGFTGWCHPKSRAD